MKNASLMVKDNTVGLNIPITKSNIDLERRIVSGWATVDNMDQGNDLVTAEASLEAFSNFRGNVREMHSPTSAVGKVVRFRPEEYVTEDGVLHTGIYVDVYISKGAESTWQKVLDETLSAFSIKGPIINAIEQYVPDLDKVVRIVTKYSLIELSLVDNPGNELCNVMSISKINEGIAANVEVKNVFWCPADRVSVADIEEVRKCLMCQGEMENLGWFEPSEDEPTADSINKVLQANNRLEQSAETLVMKGGSEMPEEVKPEETVEVVKAVDENEEIVENAPSDEEAEVEVEKVVVVEEPDYSSISKALDEIKETLAAVSQDGQSREEAMDEVRKAVSTVEDSVEARLGELLTKHSELAEEFKSFKEGLGSLEKRLDSVESYSAIKKSSDGSSDTLVKSNNESIWSNAILPISYDR